MSKSMPIGISDFKKVIENKYYYVDKSLFIKDLIDNASEVNLIARPRRFGKTINMSMLKYFFEKTGENNSILFKDLAISQYQEYKQYQEKYPVIFITLKDIKCNTWEETYLNLQTIIQAEFEKFDYLLNSNYLKQSEKDYINRILGLNGNIVDYSVSLSKLTYFLYKHYNIKPILLIDEYDVPIQSSFINGFYDNTISFMRNWLSGGLKDNTYLSFAVLTGILRVAKESIFSGLNNLEVSTVIDEQYNQYFGFTQEEIAKMTSDLGYENKLEQIKQWYDGYNFGGLEIYNPWSVINYFKNKCTPKSYWVNTSSNDIIREIINNSDNSLRQDLESLLNGKAIDTDLNMNIVYNEVYRTQENIYSFLVSTGYLKATPKNILPNIDDFEYYNLIYSLTVPNKEMTYVYRDEIISYFISSLNFKDMKNMLNALLIGDVNKFKMLFQDLVLKTISYFDTSESFYHGLMLGIVASLMGAYQVKSNRESGYGRFDIMLLPKNKNLHGIIMEFKYSDKEKDILNDAKKALEQIENNKYDTELKDINISYFHKFGIAFNGKKIEMVSN